MNTMTIKEAHQWASSFLRKHQIVHPDNDAELFIRALKNWNRSQFFLGMNQPLEEENRVKLEDWLHRRASHEPLQYIIGSQEFYGRTFKVNQHVLIPRPETELLIEALLKESAEFFSISSLSVVDIGTGSGAIAITLALEKKDWSVNSVDISRDAIDVALENARLLKAKVNFHHGDKLHPLVEKQLFFDIIISNPPYIPSHDIFELMSEVKDYEPILALDGGENGLDFYKSIIMESKKVLKPKGMIAFEIGIHQSEEIRSLMFSHQASEVKVLKDYQGIPRIVIGFFNENV